MKKEEENIARKKPLLLNGKIVVIQHKKMHNRDTSNQNF